MAVELVGKTEEVLKIIEGMTVIELSNLVKALEDKFGVSAVMPVSSATVAQAPGSAQPDVEEAKTTFDVILANSGDKKIQVIKEIRVITNLGLKEAKDLVEGAPKEIKKGASKEEAEEIKKKLESVGAKVELK